MIGAIAGDIIGSVYEASPTKSKDFKLFHKRCTFTDDSVLTVAVAHAILEGKPYGDALHSIGRRYPNAGYGGTFIQWLESDSPRPYNSWGNGAAMRVSPVGFAFDSEAEVLREAKASAEVSHNHPEGIKGAQATALAIYLARTGASREQIRQRLSQQFEYDLQRRTEDIRPYYDFDVSCQGSVPEALIAFLDSDSWEDAIRNAVSLGGDADTQACIAGGVAEAFYGGVPDEVRQKAQERLPADLREITEAFMEKYSGK